MSNLISIGVCFRGVKGNSGRPITEQLHEQWQVHMQVQCLGTKTVCIARNMVSRYFYLQGYAYGGFELKAALDVLENIKLMG
jgi:hypothetical protein